MSILKYLQESLLTENQLKVLMDKIKDTDDEKFYVRMNGVSVESFDDVPDELDVNNDKDVYTWLKQSNNMDEFMVRMTKDTGVFPLHDAFQHPEIVADQWMIHFTNDGDDVMKHGFTHGVPFGAEDLLPQTKNWDINEVGNNSYSFAFDVRDSDTYTQSHNSGEFGYGTQAIIFKANGIKFWHKYDEEHQIVFTSSSAHNMHLIDGGRMGTYWSHELGDDNESQCDGKLVDVVKCVITNYGQEN